MDSRQWNVPSHLGQHGLNAWNAVIITYAYSTNCQLICATLPHININYCLMGPGSLDHDVEDPIHEKRHWKLARWQITYIAV